MCDVMLPPGVNPTAVKYIYHIISYSLLKVTLRPLRTVDTDKWLQIRQHAINILGKLHTPHILFRRVAASEAVGTACCWQKHGTAKWGCRYSMLSFCNVPDKWGYTDCVLYTQNVVTSEATHIQCVLHVLYCTDMLLQNEAWCRYWHVATKWDHNLHIVDTVTLLQSEAGGTVDTRCRCCKCWYPLYCTCRYPLYCKCTYPLYCKRVTP
jgi:hypothetical protein